MANKFYSIIIRSLIAVKIRQASVLAIWDVSSGVGDERRRLRQRVGPTNYGDALRHMRRVDVHRIAAVTFQRGLESMS